ncbi:GatB/YqeY domain-containing protein [Govanella unica]|uniref:GatB/YqeY domain-containing protein n=1 Tax=Govanella unica TaxID=2975056 RepID=A0A9X3U201_9PROT|nr:GatB/YqeY domain-containing protein [Govania unica]MDA5194979.1 GatB/YqeY domain-containing protein [Govania unica]
MLRDQLQTAMKDALRNKESRRLTTVRMILAGIKDKDIAARGEGSSTPIADAGILELLAKMIKQRQDSIKMYEDGARPDLAAIEREEMAVIQDFLPQQLSDAEIDAAAAAAVAEIKPEGPKDMGRVMAWLKERYAGQMDFAKANAVVRKLMA